MKLTRKRLAVFSLAGWLVFTAVNAEAVMRSNDQGRTRVWLLEKIDITGYLTDNPARLLGLERPRVDQFGEIRLASTKNDGVVLAQKTQDYSWSYTLQAASPLMTGLALNLGGVCRQDKQGSRTEFVPDGSISEVIDLSRFGGINAGVALQADQDLGLGYAFSLSNTENIIDDSPTTFSTSYANRWADTSHKLGAVQGAWDAWLVYSPGNYQGDHDSQQEADFGLDSYGANLRRLWGEAGQESLVVQGGYIRTQVSTRRFDLAQQAYALDFTTDQIHLESVYSVSGADLDYALGLNLYMAQRLFFDMSSDSWQNAETYTASFPCLLRLPVLPWLRLWAEGSLAYKRDTHKQEYVLALETSFGLQMNWQPLEFTLYFLPGGEASFTTTQGEHQAAEIALELSGQF